MEAVRKEIEELWAELMMSEYEKGDFVGFIDGQLDPLQGSMRIVAD